MKYKFKPINSDIPNNKKPKFYLCSKLMDSKYTSSLAWILEYKINGESNFQFYIPLITKKNKCQEKPTCTNSLVDAEKIINEAWKNLDYNIWIKA